MTRQSKQVGGPMPGPSPQALHAVEGGFASIRQAEEYLSVSRAKLYGLMEGGHLAFAKFGKSRRIPWSALHEYAARCMQGGGAAAATC